MALPGCDIVNIGDVANGHNDDDEGREFSPSLKYLTPISPTMSVPRTTNDIDDDDDSQVPIMFFFQFGRKIKYIIS